MVMKHTSIIFDDDECVLYYGRKMPGDESSSLDVMEL